MRIRGDLIEASSQQNLNIDLNDSTEYNNRLAEFTRWMKEADVITIYMQREYIQLKECRSVLYPFQKQLKKRRNLLKIHDTTVCSNKKIQMESLPSIG